MSGIEELLTGRTLAGRYRIEEVIGRGGMGAVYRATDERLGREVAVKVIAVALPDDEERERLRARFEREAQAAARIHHPNVVTIYDFGTDPEIELDFLVMELLRGEDLAERLARSGPPPLLPAVTLLRDAARGIAAGHQLGMIHRDVKPGNLFLSRSGRGSQPRVTVLDFGIAQLAETEQTLTHLTQEGGIPLSPAYASPEQLRGERNLTPASDVFSLGAIGFQLLTGERLFDLTHGGRRADDEVLSMPSIRERNRVVPHNLEAIVQQALAFHPDDRFPDAELLAQALELASQSLVSGTFTRQSRTPTRAPGPAIVPPPAPAPPPEVSEDAATIPVVRARRRDAEPAPIPPAEGEAGIAPAPPPPMTPPPRAEPVPPAPPRPREPAVATRRRRISPALLAAPLLLVAALAGGWWLLAREPTPERTASPVPAADAPSTPSLPPEAPEVALGDAPEGDAATEPAPASEPTSTATPREQAPSASSAVPPPAAASEQPARAAGPAETTTGGSAARINVEGVRLFEQGNLAEARERLRRAVELAPRNAEYRNNYGWVLFRLGEVEAAERELRRVIELNPRRDIAYANLGEVRAARGDTAEAITMYERFLELNTDPRRRRIAEQKLRDLRARQ